jgi:hypothetical protein
VSTEAGELQATFRMALWPPLCVVMVYVTFAVSWWWWFALTLPLLLGWQWISLRRQANDALVAAFVAKQPGGKDAVSEICNTAETELLDYEKRSREDDVRYEAAKRAATHAGRVSSSPSEGSAGT